MKPKLVFACVAVAASVALFAVWPWVIQALTIPLAPVINALRGLVGAPALSNPLGEKESHFLIPALAVVIAARGASVKRKAIFVGLAVMLFVALDAIAISVDIAGLAVAQGVGAQLATVGYFTLMFAFSLAALVFFLEGRPELLWQTREVDHGRFPVCPVCGKRRANLAAHIRDAHGEKVLRSAKVQRRLGRLGGDDSAGPACESRRA
jgi:hypothetical protein